jgi:hypothetical protein
MDYRPVSTRLDPPININYYQDNKFGVDLVKAQTQHQEDHSLADCPFIEQDVQDAMSIISIFKHIITRIQKMITIYWLFYRIW